MINEFVYNVMYNTRNTIFKAKAEIPFYKRWRFVIVGDEHEIAYHLAGALCMIQKRHKICDVHVVLSGAPSRPDLMEQWKEEWPDLTFYSSLDEYLEVTNELAIQLNLKDVSEDEGPDKDSLSEQKRSVMAESEEDVFGEAAAKEGEEAEENLPDPDAEKDNQENKAVSLNPEAEENGSDTSMEQQEGAAAKAPDVEDTGLETSDHEEDTSENADAEDSFAGGNEAGDLGNETEEQPSAPKKLRNELFIEIVNLRNPKYNEPGVKEEKLAEIKRLLDRNEESEKARLEIVTCLPDITEPLPDIVHAVAEREYEVVFRDKPADSPEKFVIRIENLLRAYENQLNRLQVLRLDRVFGPGILSDDCAGVINVLESFKMTGHVNLYDSDRNDFISASYVRDALVAMLLAIQGGRKGNIYNVSSWELSRFETISILYGALHDHDMRIDTIHDEKDTTKVSYRMINARKLRLMRRRNIDNTLKSTKLASLKNTALWYLGEENYIPKTDINVYYGRMDRIREIELRILEEVDAVCKANGINYFLSAGTMLGAVRHNGFIPWDDDVDIGILPEDYEKLLKVLPDSLSCELGYQTIGLDPNSHYIHDKIRLKNSFFSTKYSDRYQMYNGVYIDVFIYYKTADTKRAQKRHIKQVALWRKIIGVRWADRVPAKKKSWKYKLAFKISRYLSPEWVDKHYRKICMKYEKKNTHYRIDGGFNLTKAGAIPDEWLHGTIEHTFEGRKFPILEHYDDFLSHWYTNKYMELLPLDGRKSVHDVVRIDLGQNLFDETAQDPQFRDVDIRGELYETIKVD